MQQCQYGTIVPYWHCCNISHILNKLSELLRKIMPKWHIYIVLPLISHTNPIISYLSLLGNLGLFIAAIRTFLVLFGRSGDMRWQVFESRTQIGFLVLGFIVIIMLGVFPQFYTPVLTNITATLSISGP